MPTREHYFVVKRADGIFEIRTKSSEKVFAIFHTEDDAIAKVNEMNGTEDPNVEPVQNTPSGAAEKTRSE